MKKLTLSLLAVLFVFSFSTIFISCGNEEKKDDATTEEITTDVEEVEVEEVADYTAGKEVFTNKCLACHQENGEGVEGSFPGLIGKACDINTVVNGREGTAMMAFKDQLTDQEIADVINYINNSWENKFDDVTVENVAAVK